MRFWFIKREGNHSNVMFSFGQNSSYHGFQQQQQRMQDKTSIQNRRLEL